MSAQAALALVAGAGVAAACCLSSSPPVARKALQGVSAGEDALGAPVELSPPQLGRMRDSTAALAANDFQALRRTLEADGYLLLRGLLDRNAVACARDACCAFLSEQGLLKPGTAVTDAVIKPGGAGVLLAKYQDTLISLPQVSTPATRCLWWLDSFADRLLVVFEGSFGVGIASAVLRCFVPSRQ